MSQKNGLHHEGAKPKRTPRPQNFTEALHSSTEHFLAEIKTMTREELAERMTAYEPGVPHYWFGRPVEPITKEELIAHWNGGPEPPIRYKDALATEAIASGKKA